MSATAHNARARSEALAVTAAEIIQAAGGIEQLDQISPHQRPLELQKLYHKMVTSTDCHWTTAKIHISKSIRRQRHPDQAPANTWGGSRGGGRPKKEESNMPEEFKATRRSKKFGWGYSTNPSGDDAYSITLPASPDYEGTIGQVTDAIASDPVYNNLGGAFSATRWFYRGRVITHVDGLDASHADSMGVITLMELAEDEVDWVNEVVLTVVQEPNYAQKGERNQTMKNVYEAIDNNGDLILLTTSKKVSISTADNHFKDTAALPILGDEHPSDTPVEDGSGKFLGTLAELTR